MVHALTSIPFLKRKVMSPILIIALPDGLAIGLVILVAAPDLLAELSSAVAANQPGGEYARATPRLTQRSAAFNFKPDSVKLVRLNNGGMAVFHIILLYLPGVLDHLLGEEVGTVSFLQKSVSLVFFVGQNGTHHGHLPYLTPDRRLYCIVA